MNAQKNDCPPFSTAGHPIYWPILVRLIINGFDGETKITLKHKTSCWMCMIKQQNKR